MAKLERNSQLGFLYKKTSIRPYVISQIALVPEFMEALMAFDGTFDNEVVYNILRTVYLKMVAEGKSYRTARDTMNKVSKDVKGDSSAWQNN